MKRGTILAIRPLYYTFSRIGWQWQADPTKRICPVIAPDLFYSGKRSSYKILSSPYTCPQLRIGRVHFLVASNVAKYKAFSNAVSRGSTLLWRLSLRYVLFRLSMAFVVYMTFLTPIENLKIDAIASQFCFQLFIELGCFSVHFSLTCSKAAMAFFCRRMINCL